MTTSTPPAELEAPTKQSRVAQRVPKRSIQRAGLIGVDVGSKTVNLAQVATRGSHQEILATQVIEIPEGANLASVGRLIAAAMRNGLFRPAPIGCLLPKSCYSEEVVELPHETSGNEIAGIWEHLQRRGFLRPEDVTVDYWRVNGEDNPSELHRYQVVAIRNRIVDDFVHECQSTGFRVECVDSIPFASSRIVSLVTPQLINQPVAVLDWGFSSSKISVIESGTPIYSRELRGASLSTATQLIAEGFGVSESDAALLLAKFGNTESNTTAFSSQMRREIGSQLQSYNRNLSKELAKTLNYIKIKLQVNSLRHLIVIGGGATIADAVSDAATELDIEAIRFQLPSFVTGDLSETPLPSFANAISLSTLGLFAGTP